MKEGLTQSSLRGCVPPLYADKQFWAAIVAAVVVWILTYFLVDNLIISRNPNLLYAIIIYPILEELAFRGFIQDTIRQKIRQNLVARLSYANILTSILFVLAHLLYQAPLWALSVFIPSLVFGYFKDRTGGVMASIVLHIFYNAGFFVIFS